MLTGEEGCQSSPSESGRQLSPVRFDGDNWVNAAISRYFPRTIVSFLYLADCVAGETVWR